MSKHSIEIITCPQCKKEIEFVRWDSINTSLDCDMKEKVLNDEAFTFVCPDCDYSTFVNYTFLYHQMEDKLMIYKVCEEEGVAETAKYMLEIQNGGLMANEKYTSRIVRTHNELKEKILIFDAGFDDRIIEIYKIVICAKVSENPDINFDYVFFSPLNDESYLVFLDKEDIVGSVKIDHELYNSLAESFSDKIEESSKDNFVFDFLWAKKLFGI